MSLVSPHAGPVTTAERVVSLDVVRGLAVLGILVMNIVEFAWPDEAYGNPAFAGGCAGCDLWTWYVQVALFDGKMRALFSMLFGAGLVLVAERMAQRGDGMSATDLLLRRCLWLVPFGIVHRFFLQWTGDILYQYGLLGVLAVTFRHLRARTLIIAGLVWMLAFVPIGLRRYQAQCETRSQAEQAERMLAADANATVPAELAAAQKRWQTRAASIPPKPEVLQKELAEVRVGYWQLFRNRWDYHHNFQSSFLYYHWIFDVLGMMLLGMGLAKTGFFHGRWRASAYVGVLIAGALTTAALFVWAMAWQATGFSVVALELRLIQDLTYAHSRALVALAWASALLLVLRAGVLQMLTHALAAVGRMAFSCYILQTVLGSLLFYGYGFGLFGTIPRAWLMVVMLGMSIVQVVFALLWLRAFRFGPLEWAWRSLTWWQRQPLRR